MSKLKKRKRDSKLKLETKIHSLPTGCNPNPICLIQIRSLIHASAVQWWIGGLPDQRNREGITAFKRSKWENRNLNIIGHNSHQWYTTCYYQYYWRSSLSTVSFWCAIVNHAIKCAFRVNVYVCVEGSSEDSMYHHNFKGGNVTSLHKSFKKTLL